MMKRKEKTMKNKTFFRKILSLTLAVSLAITMMPGLAFAAGDTRYIVFEKDVYQAVIPASGSDLTLVAAEVFAEGGVKIPVAPGDIVYSLDEPYPGVSINSVTGMVTVNWLAGEGTAVITAEYEDLSASVDLELTKYVPVPVPAYIAFMSASYRAYIPASGSSSISLTARAYDENDKEVPASIAYSLAGVSAFAALLLV